jgi:hypothetical protein
MAIADDSVPDPGVVKSAEIEGKNGVKRHRIDTGNSS